MDWEGKDFKKPVLAITALLVPPTTSFIARARSFSNASSRSRPGTPTASLPSTPNGAADLSPRISTEVPKHSSVKNVMTVCSAYLAPSDILSASAAVRDCSDLRTAQTFRNWMSWNGWDTSALDRRLQETKGVKGRPWLHWARSAIHKDTILKQYHALLEDVKSASKDKDKHKHLKKQTEKLIGILMSAVTEHDNRNFPTLISLAGTLNKSFLQFVATIPAESWKLRYQKTFLMAAYVNTYPSEPEIEENIQSVVESIDLMEASTSPAFKAAHDNFLYSYACFAFSHIPPQTLPSLSYDPPHHTISFRSFSIPGLRQAAERYQSSSMLTKGAYRKANGEESDMEMRFQHKEHSNKLSIPFVDKHQLALSATVSDGVNPEWQMQGSVNLETGRGSMKSAQGMVYDLRTTPWGIVGEKLMGEKHLGYFVLQWS